MRCRHCSAEGFSRSPVSDSWTLTRMWPPPARTRVLHSPSGSPHTWCLLLTVQAMESPSSQRKCHCTWHMLPIAWSKNFAVAQLHHPLQYPLPPSRHHSLMAHWESPFQGALWGFPFQIGRECSPTITSLLSGECPFLLVCVFLNRMCVVHVSLLSLPFFHGSQGLGTVHLMCVTTVV